MRKRRVMVYGPHFCRLWQQVFKMSTPTCRVVTFTDAKGGSVVDDRFNPLANTIGGFGLF